MNEIERAIARLEFFKSVRGYWDNTADVAEIDTALRILRAELEREKNPLTCDGCEWEFNRSLGSADMCYNCNRMRKKDRYEPKGERDDG